MVPYDSTIWLNVSILCAHEKLWPEYLSVLILSVKIICTHTSRYTVYIVVLIDVYSNQDGDKLLLQRRLKEAHLKYCLQGQKWKKNLAMHYNVNDTLEEIEPLPVIQSTLWWLQKLVHPLIYIQAIKLKVGMVGSKSTQTS